MKPLIRKLEPPLVLLASLLKQAHCIDDFADQATQNGRPTFNAGTSTQGPDTSPHPIQPGLFPEPHFPDLIAPAMWLKRLFGRAENAPASGHGPSRKETEQGREDRQKDFMNEQVRQRDEDESHMQDKPFLMRPSRCAVHRGSRPAP
jgi:hypothetical protein